MNHRSSAVEPKLKNQLPTAIVKPKYQKSSFDDRQLPALAYVHRDQPWYDKQPTNELIKIAAPLPTKKIHLPEFDRKAKKHVKHTTKSAHIVHTTPNKCSAKENSKKSDMSEKDSDSSVLAAHKRGVGASVAIVQPRKKEKMDERVLMETIHQMQIKKNSMDSNRSNSIAANQISITNNSVKINTVDNLTKCYSSKTNNHTVKSNNNANASHQRTEEQKQKKDQKDVSGNNNNEKDTILFIINTCNRIETK